MNKLANQKFLEAATRNLKLHSVKLANSNLIHCSFRFYMVQINLLITSFYLRNQCLASLFIVALDYTQHILCELNITTQNTANKLVYEAEGTKVLKLQATMNYISETETSSQQSYSKQPQIFLCYVNKLANRQLHLEK